jgi:hypothetical protein
VELRSWVRNPHSSCFLRQYLLGCAGDASGTRRSGLDGRPPVRSGGTHLAGLGGGWDPHGRLGGAGPTCKVVGQDGWDPCVMGKWGVGPTCHGVG